MRSTLIAAACTLLLGSGSASAATITFSNLQPLSDVDISVTLSVSKFDPSLGTLTGVTWSITGAVASILGVQNDGPNSVTGAASVSVDFNVNAAGLSLGGSPDFNVLASTGPVTLLSGESVLFPITNSTTITGSETPSALFIGPGSLDLIFATLTSFGASGFGGDITVSQASDAGLEFSVTYEYGPPPSEVPLPAALPLFLAGIGAMAWAARGRKRKFIAAKD